MVVAVFVGLYGLALWGGFRWARARLNRRSRELAGALEAAQVKVLGRRDAPSVRGRAEIDLEGGALLSVRQWGRDGQLISVGLPEPAMPPIWIRRERALDRMAKALGFEREVQLGDAEFDQAHYVASSASDERVRTTLAGAETRRLIAEIVALGYSVTLSQRGVSASLLKSIFSPFDASGVPGLVERLRQLAASLPKTTSIEPIREPVSTRAILVPAFVSMLVPAVVALMARDVLHPPIDNGAVGAAILLGLVPWFLVVILVARRLRSRPLAMLEVPALALALVIWVPFSFAFGLFYINSHWDGSAPEVHHTRVVDYYRRNRHTVYVAPWDESGARRKVIVPDAIARVDIGDALEIESHPGALGWTWVSSVRAER
jgi:hypothetical protein